jgi:hypothetical protein
MFGGSVSLSGDGSVLVAATFDSTDSIIGHVEVYEFVDHSSPAPSLLTPTPSTPPSVTASPSSQQSLIPSAARTAVEPSSMLSAVPSAGESTSPSDVSSSLVSRPSSSVSG